MKIKPTITAGLACLCVYYAHQQEQPAAPVISPADPTLETLDTQTIASATSITSLSTQPSSEEAVESPLEVATSTAHTLDSSRLSNGAFKSMDTRLKYVAALDNHAQETLKNATVRAESMGLITRGRTVGGMEYQLAGFEGKLPLYRATNNENAAITNAASLINTPSSLYNLQGGGMHAGIWDSNACRTSHQEFGGRVQKIDSASLLSYHHTHVSGTILGNGSQSNARGMAPMGQLTSHDWNSDFAEMANEAAASENAVASITTSNHSYGYLAGWAYVNISGTTAWHWMGDGTTDTEHETFGNYNSGARTLDNICVAAPYFLPFWAAGNDRNDGPNNNARIYLWNGFQWQRSRYKPDSHPPRELDLQYDTIAGEAVAKNIMTVGAVSDAVSSGSRDLQQANITIFSSWGPTDDGRIKPDIVANGDSLTSADSSSDTSYLTLSGTSMSTPSAMGAAMLIQQRYAQINSYKRMPSSLQKALILHSADDLGNPGPDYSYGWGLMNAKAAVELLDKHEASPSLEHLSVINLNDGSSHQRQFQWDGSSSEIRITLCWTDPVPASAIYGIDNPQSALVNDLDIRLTSPTGETTLPWILDPTAPSASATRGDNTRDNVEQIILNLPVAGNYTLSVNHKGTLTGGNQVCSIIIDGHKIGPHAQWEFDQIQDLNVADTGGSHFDGTLSSSGASPIQGMRGQGLYLDGIQGSVTIPPLNLVNPQTTLTAWVKLNRSQDPDVAILYNGSNNLSSGLTIKNGNSLAYQWNAGASDTATLSSLTLPSEQWCFIALVIHPTQTTLYLHDGTSMHSSIHQVNNSASNFSDSSSIGWDGVSPYRLDACLDEIRIYQRALPPDELLDVYYAGLSDVSRHAYDEGLVGEDLEPLADADGDGVSNLVEYVLGSSLTTPNSPITTSYSEGLLTLNFTDMNRPGFIIIPEWSDDLIQWSSTGFIISNEGASIGATGDQMFVRLRVTSQ